MENRGDLSNVQWVVLSPDIDWNPPEGWNRGETGEVDFMNSGGEWTIWTTHDEVLVY